MCKQVGVAGGIRQYELCAAYKDLRATQELWTEKVSSLTFTKLYGKSKEDVELHEQRLRTAKAVLAVIDAQVKVMIGAHCPP